VSKTKEGKGNSGKESKLHQVTEMVRKQKTKKKLFPSGLDGWTRYTIDRDTWEGH